MKYFHINRLTMQSPVQPPYHASGEICRWYSGVLRKVKPQCIRPHSVPSTDLRVGLCLAANRVAEPRSFLALNSDLSFPPKGLGDGSEDRGEGIPDEKKPVCISRQKQKHTCGSEVM